MEFYPEILKAPSPLQINETPRTPRSEATGRRGIIRKRMKQKKNKYQKHIKLYLPKLAFDNLHYKLHFGKPPFEYDIEIFYSILNDLSNIKYPKDYEDKNEMIPMASIFLKEKYGNQYAKYIQYLNNNSIIGGSNYSKGECSHYSLVTDRIIHDMLNNEGYYSSSYCLHIYQSNEVQLVDNKGIKEDSKMVNYSGIIEVKIPTTGKVGKYILKHHFMNLDRIKHSGLHIKAMWQHYKTNLSIDYDSAIRHTNLMYEADIQSASNDIELQKKAYWKQISRMKSIQHIHAGKNELRFNRNKTNNRLDTNLTNMAKDLRPFLIGYEEMSYFDLKNSQPVLFNIILKKIDLSKNSKLESEIAHYHELTLSGKWYEFLADLYGYTEKFDKSEARANAKKLWMLIAYSKNSTKFNKTKFRKKFPEIMKLIESLKSKGHEKFAIELQKIESRIFIDEISKELIENGIVPYTFHDAFMIPKQHEEKTYVIMAKILESHLGGIPVIDLNDSTIISDN
jgi:hypothetical protein